MLDSRDIGGLQGAPLHGAGNEKIGNVAQTIDELKAAFYDVGVMVQDGRQFHGPCHLRMNLASPNSRIREAFDRLARYVFTP